MMIQPVLNYYRLHFINRATGQIAHTYEFHAADDEKALEFAELWAEDAPMELWGAKGRIRHWDGPDEG